MGVRHYPALDISFAVAPDRDLLDRLLAELHDAAPTAVEDRAHGLRVFFASAAARDAAAGIVEAFDRSAACEASLVSDDEWAERSQATLTAVTVGRLIVSPPWIAAAADAPPGEIRITIQPSMGFGTGHHASTRLCLALLQQRNLTDATLLDVGTGSGVLALAAWRLGAPRVLGIDADPDALTSAAENVEANRATAHVELQLLDIAHASGYFLQRFDVVTANLTGGMLERYAPDLSRLVSARGALIVSGFQTHEVRSVEGAFALAGLQTTGRSDESDWVALELTR